MNSVETILIENIDKPESLFIFPTDISVSGWADHLLRIKGGSVGMDKFIAWDKFKQNSVKSKVKDKKSVPSALRKIFISCLINENAQLVSQGSAPIFSSLIKEEWANSASHFTSWLTSILPQLGAWFLKMTNVSIDKIFDVEAKNASLKFEGDDKDMFVLATRYAQFLNEHGLFEPAWETPPFNNNGKECFLFFPESLSDYSEYRELLQKSEHVKIISVKETEIKNCDTFFYTNSRREITEACLYIRALNEKQNIPWESIAVCIPDSNNYEPYVLREFSNRNIPFVKRTSKPLCDYPAGNFFASLLECVSCDFSFDSLVSLIMNKALPWKDAPLIEKLIQFGINNNCLYSWTESKGADSKHINVWEDAFEYPYKHNEREIFKFFNDLKKRVLALRGTDSFAELRKQYFIFRDYFFDMSLCSDETDLVLSRCISELMNLTELEKDYPDVRAVDPFSFFTEFISDVNYLAQSELSGVAVLPYKTAACAPFDCHVILGAGHENISVVYPHLSFLPRLKRKELDINDEDASEAYINLHKFNSVKKAAFFCAEQTFTEFSIPHTKIDASVKPTESYANKDEYKDLFSSDNYSAESIFCSNPDLNKSKDKNLLHENQIAGFTEWKKRRNHNKTDNKWKAHEEVRNKINSIFVNNGKTNLSATTMQSYNFCSLNWLFNRVFKIDNAQIETSLMDSSISGSVYHAIFETFFNKIKEEGKPILAPLLNESENEIILPETYKTVLNECIDAVFNCFPSLKQDEGPKMSALTARLLSSSKKDFKYHCEFFIAQFISFFAGCSVIDCEKYYESKSETYMLKGFIDIILKDKSDKYIIVDYKIKYMPSRNECVIEEKDDELSNFQLPSYITLLEENENYKVYNALFFSIIDGEPEIIIGKASNIVTEKTIPNKIEKIIEKDSEKYKLIFEAFKEKTRKYAKEIASANFTVFPKKTNECFDCSYHRICRTVYVIKRENL